MVCPSIYFAGNGLEKTTFRSAEMEVSSEETIVDFPFTLGEHIEFVAVKVVIAGGEEIYYKTVEVSTFWG